MSFRPMLSVMSKPHFIVAIFGLSTLMPVSAQSGMSGMEMMSGSGDFGSGSGDGMVEPPPMSPPAMPSPNSPMLSPMISPPLPPQPPASPGEQYNDKFTIATSVMVQSSANTRRAMSEGKLRKLQETTIDDYLNLNKYADSVCEPLFADIAQPELRPTCTSEVVDEAMVLNKLQNNMPVNVNINTFFVTNNQLDPATLSTQIQSLEFGSRLPFITKNSLFDTAYLNANPTLQAGFQDNSTASTTVTFVTQPVTTANPPSVPPSPPPMTPPPSSGLDGGAIAGIVIGCVAGVILIAVAFWFISKKGGKSDKPAGNFDSVNADTPSGRNLATSNV